MSTAVPDTTNAATPAATLDYDLRCCHCGYNLRTLSLDGRCPECAEPVHSSFQKFNLSLADPAWLDHLRRGVLLVIVAGLLFGPSTCGPRVANYVLYAAFYLEKSFSLPKVLTDIAVYGLLVWGPYACFLAATFLLTSRQGIIRDIRRNRFARILRLVAVGTVALSVATYCANTYVSPRSFTTSQLILARNLLDAVWTILLWSWIAGLARQAADAPLRRLSIILAFVAPLPTLAPNVIYNAAYWAFVYCGWRSYPDGWSNFWKVHAFVTALSIVGQFAMLLRLRKDIAAIRPAGWLADGSHLLRVSTRGVLHAASAVVRAIRYHGPNTPPPPASHNEP